MQRKRQAAQRLAQKKAAQQRREQTQAKTGGTKTEQPASVQQAAKVRTPASRASSQTGGNNNAKPYSKTVENPYGRYTSGGEEDASYTASFKPDESKTSGSNRRRRTGGNGNGNGDTQA